MTATDSQTTDSDLSHLSDVTFASLNLHPHLMAGIEKAGFEFCTPIQAGTLPLALHGKDVAGQAQTGTGKTAAFLLATLHKLLTDSPGEARKPQQIRSLILAPTRELAIQIHKDAAVLANGTDLKLGLAYGGTDYDKQRDQLAAGVDILIGTPGRVIDYFKQCVFDMKCLEVMVLDEADRMFDLGFIADVRYMLRHMPPADQRVNLMFSATLSQKVAELAYEHMNEPETIRIEADQVTADKVEQSVYYPASDEKIPLLVGLLREVQPTRSMVFVNTKRVAERLERWLNANGFLCAVLSGDVPQKKRQVLLKKFQQGELPMLVTTDVAARGLHIDGVSHVFNYDLPNDAEDYVHRIGRTARAGASGVALSFACEEYAFSLPDVEKYIEMKIPRAPVTNALLADDLTRPPPRERKPRPDGRGGRGGRDGGRGRGGSNSSGGSRSRGGSASHSNRNAGGQSGPAKPDAPKAESADSAEAPKRRRRGGRGRGKPAGESGSAPTNTEG